MVSNSQFSNIQDGILTNETCSDCIFMSSYDKTMHSVTTQDPNISGGSLIHARNLS